tara:strand:+ start:6961 stop:9432 length:2472 start_codon:yes stop_codon:yes gene_type:complete
MTVTSNTITAGPYTGNGVSDTFSYSFELEDKSEIKVFETNDSGVQTLIVVDTDYTVNNVGDPSGTVTRVAGALPTGYSWYMRSDYKETQETEFDSQGAFYPDIHEKAFDKNVHLTQQLADIQSRSPTLSEGYSGTYDLTLPDPVEGEIMEYTADGIRGTSAVEILAATNSQVATNTGNITSNTGRIASIEGSFIAGDTRYVETNYKGGSAEGGELFLTVPYVFELINSLYINGVRQTRGLAWVGDKATQIIELADELNAGDEVVIEVGLDPESIIDNQVVNSDSPITPTNGGGTLTLAEMAAGSDLPLATIVALSAFEPSIANQRASIIGHTVAGIGGGEFYWHQADTTSADNNGTVIVTADGKRWKRMGILSGVTPEIFGALGGSNDDTVAIQAAFDNVHNAKTILQAVTYEHTGLSIPNGATVIGQGKGRSILKNTHASNTSVKIPYDDDLNFYTKILLSDFTILAGVVRSGSQVGFDIDTAQQNKFSNISVSSHATNIQEKSSWSNVFDSVQSIGGINMWDVISGDSTNGTPNTHINCDGEDCVNGISIDIRGHSSSVWVGGAIEHMQNHALKIFGNDDRTITFIGVNFEGNQESTGGVSGADVILGDASIGASSAPSNIKFDTCQFTQTDGTQTRPAFDLVFGDNLTLDTCHFIGYPQVADLSSNFGKFNLRQLGGISKFADSTDAATDIPASGIVQGNRLSFTHETNGVRTTSQSASNNDILKSRRHTESHDRFEISASGGLGWHAFNSASADVVLNRTAVGVVGVNGTYALSTGSGTTGSRPYLASLKTGSFWFDTTLGIPIFSNGSGWVDAAGNSV